MKVVVTGASGLLGRAVCAGLKADGHTVLGTAHSRATPDSGLAKLDLTDFDGLEAYLRQQAPDAIVHTAAERRPDVVERSPEASHVLNVDVPSRIAAWCKAQAEPGPLLINISTDYVFDGVSPPYSVDDPPNPLNAYGKSKWEGEKGVRDDGRPGRTTNLRVPVLYGRTMSNDESAVNILLDALTVGPDAPPKKMDANAVRYPTNVDDIAKALSQLCTKFAGPTAQQIPPTLHFSAMEAMTKYDMCLVMARCLRAVGEEAETEHLEPEYEIDPNAATSRPRHCKLDLSVIKGLGIDTECTSFEHWWREYLEEYAVTARENRAKQAAEAEAKRQAEEAERNRREEERKAQEQEEERRRKVEEEERRRNEEEERKMQEAEEVERKKREDEAGKAKQLQGLENVESSTRELIGNLDQEPKAQDSADDATEADERRADDRARPRSDGQNEVGSSNEHAPTTHGVAQSTSSAGPASLRSPTSPNPSFSSLQARPTPPATSGRNSPAPSILSATGGPVPIPSSSSGAHLEKDETAKTATSTSTSYTETGPAAGGRDTPLDPLDPDSTPQLHNDYRRDPKTDRQEEDASGFLPTTLIQGGDGAALGIRVSSGQAKESADADSDGYGQPSPRGEGPEHSPSKAPFAAGYGEVPFGLDESGGQVHRALESTSGENSVAKAAAPTLNAERPKTSSFQIRVGDPQKVGDPVTAHIVYTVRIKTDSPHFRSSRFSVLRRYSDFRWLHAALVHNNPGIFVPPVPEKVKIGRFAPDLVEARRHGLESCVNKIANNPVLQFDDDLRLFLESQNFHADVKARDQIKGPVPTPEQKTYFGWSTSLTGTTYRYHETDEWFDEQKVYLDHLELQLKTLVRVVSTLAQQRKDVAAATSETSHALMMLSGSSLSRALSTCFAGLGEVERRTFELADVQADADVRDFGSVVYEFERMVGSARKAFATRIDAWQTWQRYEDEAKKVRVKHEKVKREMQPGSLRAHDGGRLQAVLDELATIETRCLNAKREFDVIGRRCKEEMDRFEWDRIRSFHEACEVWLQGMIERSHEIMAEWEQYAALLERQTGHKIHEG